MMIYIFASEMGCLAGRPAIDTAIEIVHATVSSSSTHIRAASHRADGSGTDQCLLRVRPLQARLKRRHHQF